MYCEVCGSEIYDKSDLCERCGTKVKKIKDDEINLVNLFNLNETGLKTSKEPKEPEEPEESEKSDNMQQGNYFYVERNKNTENIKISKINKVRKNLLSFRAVVILSLILIFGGAGTFLAVNRILYPELIKMLVEPSLDYEWIIPYDDELLWVVSKEQKFGFIDKKGNTVVPAVYDYINAFREGLAGAGKDGKAGYIDRNGNTVIDFIYDGAYDFNSGLAVVFAGDYKRGAINKDGEIVIPFIYREFTEFKDGYASARKNGGWGIIDGNGEIVVPFEYDYIYNRSDGFFTFYKNEKFGLMSTDGEIICGEYDFIGEFKEGLAAVRKDEKFGYIDMSGELVIPAIYDRVYDFNSEGLSLVSLPHGGIQSYYNSIRYKWEIIDKTGETVVAIPDRYTYVSEFSDDLAVVGNFDSGGTGYRGRRIKYGYIDKTGKLAIPMIYDNAQSFENGLAVVGVGDKTGVIDKAGDEVIPLVYDGNIRIIGERQLMIAETNGKFGILNKNGDIILPFEYDAIYEGVMPNDTNRLANLVCVNSGGKWGILELK